MSDADVGGRRWSAEEAAALLGAELLGDRSVRLHDVAVLERAGPGSLTFIREARYLAQWPGCGASAALVTRRVWAEGGAGAVVPPGKAVLLVEDADIAMARLLGVVERLPTMPSGVHPSAVVDPTAALGPGVGVGAGSVVGARAVIGAGTILHPRVVIGEAVVIGAGCVLHPGVAVLHDCTLGDRVVLQPGVSVGADGFGYVTTPGGLMKVPHAGRVEIGNDVEVGANSTIDRAKFGATTVGDGTKIDNLVQIGHGCTIGRHCLICGCCGLSGSVTMGDGSVLAGGVGVADNVTIGAGAKVGARSGVMHDVPAGEQWVGYPAEAASRYLRIAAAIRSLPDVLPQMKRFMKNQS